MSAVTTDNSREVWVTGIGLVSSLGEGAEAHFANLRDPAGKPVVDEAKLAPYPFHPLAAVDFGKQIPKKSDQRQMEIGSMGAQRLKALQSESQRACLY